MESFINTSNNFTSNTLTSELEWLKITSREVFQGFPMLDGKPFEITDQRVQSTFLKEEV